MTQTGTSNAIVNLMLGWLKGLASWVLRLFNLSGGISPLKFLANNWLGLLILLLIVGVAADLLVWLIRWRPHWVWFHKKRVIINDKNFFAGEDEVDDEDDWEMPAEYARKLRTQPRRDWRDDDYVVAGEARRRREAREREQERRRRARAAQVKSMQLAPEPPSEPADDVFTDGMFNVNAKQKFSDRYEDEVFSVSNLPSRPGEDGGAAGAADGARSERSRREGKPRREEKTRRDARTRKETRSHRDSRSRREDRPRRAGRSRR